MSQYLNIAEKAFNKTGPVKVELDRERGLNLQVDKVAGQMTYSLLTCFKTKNGKLFNKFKFIIITIININII